MQKPVIALLLGLSSILAADSKPDFDWSKAVIVPPSPGESTGNQILHFKCENHHYTEDPKAVAFVERHLQEAQPLDSDASVLRYASDAVTIDGAYLEMGVCTGRTINFLAGLNPQQQIYGFDSFEGLPEAWDRDDVVWQKGTCGLAEGDAPPVLHNVELVRGLFANSLPTFKKEVLGDQPIALLHMDCDIYSSTVDVLKLLEANIVPGTVIAFDELYNYPGAERHEWKALQEYLDRTGREVEFLAFNGNHEQVVVRVLPDNATHQK